MLLLLRLAATLLRPLPAGEPLDPRATVVTRWRVLPNDVDAFGHMNNSRYQSVMDLARIDFLRRCGLFRGVLRNRWAVPVGSVHMVYRKPLAPLERYELHTRLLHWDERWFYFRQEFFRAADLERPVCSGYVTTLFRGRAGVIGTAQVVRELAGRELESPALTDEVRDVFRLAAPGPAG